MSGRPYARVRQHMSGRLLTRSNVTQLIKELSNIWEQRVRQHMSGRPHIKVELDNTCQADSLTLRVRQHMSG